VKTNDIYAMAMTAVVPGATRTVETACPRITAPSAAPDHGTGLPAVGAFRVVSAFPGLDGTGLSAGGFGAVAVEPRLDKTRPSFVATTAPVTGARGVDGGTGAGPVMTGARVRVLIDEQGIPPRRTPSRC
jgi:hypothetical protein